MSMFSSCNLPYITRIIVQDVIISLQRLISPHVYIISFNNERENVSQPPALL